MEDCKLRNLDNTCKVTNITCHYTDLCKYVCQTYKEEETEQDRQKTIQEKALAVLKSWLE